VFSGAANPIRLPREGESGFDIVKMGVQPTDNSPLFMFCSLLIFLP
jgi:hypothetical protein